MSAIKAYEDYQKELIKLEKEDETTFKKITDAKNATCIKQEKSCMTVFNSHEGCLNCEYFLNTIKPLEDQSLSLLIKITDLQKKVNEGVKEDE